MEENKVININDHIEKEESVDETVFDNIMRDVIAFLKLKMMIILE